jgi:hypothetical protein
VNRELYLWQAVIGRPLPQLGYPECHGAVPHGQGFWLLVRAWASGAPACI